MCIMLDPRQFQHELHIRNTNTRISGTKKTYQEHLQYNEKKGNIKNITLDRRQLFSPCQSFMGQRYPCHSRQNFDPHHFFDSCQNFKDPRQDFTVPRHQHRNHVTYTHESMLYTFLIKIP